MVSVETEDDGVPFDSVGGSLSDPELVDVIVTATMLYTQV